MYPTTEFCILIICSKYTIWSCYKVTNYIFIYSFCSFLLFLCAPSRFNHLKMYFFVTSKINTQIEKKISPNLALFAFNTLRPGHPL